MITSLGTKFFALQYVLEQGYLKNVYLVKNVYLKCILKIYFSISTILDTTFKHHYLILKSILDKN